MKRLVCLLAIMVIAVPAVAEQLFTCDWECELPGGMILGSYSDITASLDNTIYRSSDTSLKLVDGGASGTPQAYVGWVEGLNVGDEVTASFWCYDTTPGASPSGRIWGHYNEFNDINDYAGSAGGNDTYSDGSGWSFLEWTWTYNPTDPDATGLVIEARTYSGLGDTIWVDDLTISAPDHATVMTPCIPEPMTLALLGLGGLVSLRRRR